MNTKSPLVWFGGKANIANKILELMAPHDCYVEPFGGAAHVLAAKPPTKVDVYNDINGDVVNFLMVLRKDPERLFEECRTLPYSRALFGKWQDELFHQRRNGGDMEDFDRAVKFFYVNRLGINGGGLNHKSGWKHSSMHNSPRVYQNICQRIQNFAERMRGVVIDQQDFRHVIPNYDGPRTQYYVDPPYVGCENRYTGGFNEKDHRDLAEILRGIKGKAIVSYYDDPIISELYQDWRRVEIKTHKNSVKIEAGYERPEATELLLMNFDNEQMTIFDALGEAVVT